MVHTAQAPVPSVGLFQEFVGQLIQLKELARIPDPDPGTIDVQTEPAQAAGGGTALAVASRVTSIWNRTLTLLEQQVVEATRIAGPVGAEFHRQALYVMAALADETFVHLQWEGRTYWLDHLLEWRVFRSHAAGDLFFRRIEELLRREDEAAAEVASVYLMALALGFRGKFWGPEHQVTLDGYRARLFTFISSRNPDLSQPVQRLFPQAYRNTIQTSAPLKLVTPRPWLWGLGLSILAWIVIAQLLWWNLTHSMNDSLCKLRPNCALSANPLAGVGK